MKTAPSISLIVLFCALAQLACAAEGVWGNNRRLFALPVPKKVTVDGKLDDWDTSGAMFVTLNREVAERFHGWIMTMYDEEAIYIGARVRDDTPMNNLHGPEGDAQWAWNADAMQFRFFTDPSVGPTVFREKGKTYPVAHLLLWYFSLEEKPCMKLSFGYRFRPYGGGTGVVPPDRYAAAYRKNDDETGYSLEYRLPWELFGMEEPLRAGDIVPGTVQIMFDDGSGLRSPRRFAASDLLSAYAPNPWRQYESWGRIIFSDRRSLPTQFTRIQNTPERPTPLSLSYELPEDSVVSLDVQNTEGRTVRRLLAQKSRSAGTCTEKWDGLDGAGNPLPPGDYSFVGIHHEPIETRYLVGVNNAGNPTWHTTDGRGTWGGDHGLPAAVCRTQCGMALAWSSQESAPGIILIDDEGQKQWGAFFNSATCMATDGKRLFFGGTRRARTVRLMDARRGRRIAFENGRATVDSWHEGNRPPTITGLAYGDETLYAAYARESRIVCYDGATGDVQNIWDIPQPRHLTALRDGHLLVASGKEILKVTPDGKHTPFLTGDHVADPRGTAVGPEGHIYLANGGELQNVSVFSYDGQYLKSIGKPGGRPRVGRHDPSGMLEPWTLALDGRGRLWVTEHIDRPKRISVWDVESGQNVREFFGVARFANFAGIDPENPDEVISADATLWEVNLETGEKQFKSTLWRKTGDDMPETFHNFRLIRANNGHQYIHPYRGPRTLYLRVGNITRPFCELFPKKDQAWQDQNGDGGYQDDEFSELTVKVGRHIQCVDRDLNIWVSGHVFRPTDIGPDGQPHYDFSRPEKTGIRCSGPIPRMMNDPADGTYYVVRPGRRTEGRLQPGTIDKMKPDGTVLWRYPNVIAWRDAWNMGIPPAGHIYGPWGLPTMKGDFLAVGTFRGSCHLLTRDGMYVTTLLPDIRRMRFGPGAIKQEMHGGTLAEWKDGKYLLGCGDNDARVLEVTGLDTIRRFSGKFTINPEDNRRVKRALATHRATRSRAMPLFIARGAKSLQDIPKRGEPQAQKITRVADGEHSFTARMAYDPRKLHVRCEIQSPTKPVTSLPANQLPDGGNVVDIQFKPEGGSALRLLVGQNSAGHPRAALLKDGEPRSVNEDVRISEYRYDRGSRRLHFRFAVPLQLLGWQPRPVSMVEMDVGYLFGNQDGTACVKRAYWHSEGRATGTAFVE